MNKSLSLVLALSVLSAMGYAQTNLDKEVDTELDAMYSTTKAPAPAPKDAAVVSGQPIYILNQATPTANSQSTSTATSESAAAAVQKQPTTVIEASPLTESRAESLRKARQEAETSTEAKIVEKLEQSRLEDERRRAQLLFGNKPQPQENAEGLVQPAPAQQQAPAPQIIIIPQQAPAPVAPVAPTVTEAKKEEITIVEKPSPLVEKEMSLADKAEGELSMTLPPVKPTSQKYFTGSVGVPSLASGNDVQGNYALGFTFGNKYDDSYAVEASFIYASLESKNVNNTYWTGRPDLFDVNQYSGAVAMKWFLLPGMVKPVLGALAQYSYRDFKWSDKNWASGVNPGNSTSHAVDVGGIAGVEVEFNPRMSLGFDVRYYKNLLVRRNYSTDDYNNSYYQNVNNSRYGYRTPIEDLDYYTLSLSARVLF